MDEDLLEVYVKQYIQASRGPNIEFSWQGGEPTLRGLDFYRKLIELQEKHLPPGWVIQNSLQTNATLLNDEWATFFKENAFLVGVSLDGPQHLHDAYRLNRHGQGTHRQVVENIDLLTKHGVDFNVLCVVSDLNSCYPKEVYDFFKDLGVQVIQFIPLVEKGDRKLNEFAPKSGAYATFLITIFNEWLQHDFGEVHIQIFEEALRIWAGYGASMCVFSEICGDAMVMEHNGDLYSCDHFVNPNHKLGNIMEKPLTELVNSEKQINFGLAKQASLPQECLSCEVRFICQGGCSKNRISETKNGAKINYLCADYKRFFTYIAPFMDLMQKALKKGYSRNHTQRIVVDLYNSL